MDTWTTPTCLRQSCAVFSRTLVLTLVLLQGSGHVIGGQRLPTRDEEHFRHSTTHDHDFYDTRLLPDGASRRLYLAGGRSSYYFLVEEDLSRLSFVLTPCARDVIRWRLLYQQFPSENPPKLDGGMFDQTKPSRRRKQQQGRYILHEGDIRGTRLTYTIKETISGLYTLELTPTRGAASIDVYGSTSVADNPYPELPADRRVRVKQTADTDLTISWRPSPTDSLHRQPVQYCVVVNRRRPLPNHCTALTYRDGDRSPPLPANVGFGFPGERDQYKPVKIKPKAKYEVFHTCVQTNTTFTFSEAVPGHKYYVGVHVVNTQTNASSAYTGGKKRLRRAKTRAQIMSEGKIHTTHLSPTSSPDHWTFTLATRTEQLYVVVQPCASDVQVTLTRNGDLVNGTTAGERAWEFTQSRARKGVYRLTVSGATVDTDVRLTYATSRHDLLFPVLPADSSVKVDSVTCDSVTVTWPALPGDNQYCTYVRRADELVTSQHNWCANKRNRKKKHKVSCTSHSVTSPSRDLVQTITDLTAGVDHVIDVYVSGSGSDQWLPYVSAGTQTLSECSSTI